MLEVVFCSKQNKYLLLCFLYTCFIRFLLLPFDSIPYHLHFLVAFVNKYNDERDNDLFCFTWFVSLKLKQTIWMRHVYVFAFCIYDCSSLSCFICTQLTFMSVCEIAQIFLHTFIWPIFQKALIDRYAVYQTRVRAGTFTQSIKAFCIIGKIQIIWMFLYRWYMFCTNLYQV